jgi:hypothetical protein
MCGQIKSVAAALARLQRLYHLMPGNHDVECYRRNPQKPETVVAGGNG